MIKFLKQVMSIIKEDYRQFLKQLKCSHKFEVVHQDAACSVEQCEACGKTLIFGCKV